MFKTKILFLGPCETGKTTIANYLADASEVIGGLYRPTQGVRILEFESNGLEINGRNINAEVELWDCSGDKKSILSYFILHIFSNLTHKCIGRLIEGGHLINKRGSVKEGDKELWKDIIHCWS